MYLQAIFNRLNNLPTDKGFPANSRPFIYTEVIDLGGEPITGAEYVGMGRVTEFKYGKFLGEAFRGKNQLKYLVNWGKFSVKINSRWQYDIQVNMVIGEQWGMLASGNALTFIDNHDNQRGHGAGGDMILTFRTPKLYKVIINLCQRIFKCL